MSGSSASQDLPMTLLPLTSQHRDEIDQTVLERVPPGALKMIVQSEGADTTTTESLLVLINTILAASTLLKREHLEDNLDVNLALAKETLRQHPKLQEIIRRACEMRSFSHIADLEIYQIPQNTSPCRRRKMRTG
jgi:hypothetical protein